MLKEISVSQIETYNACPRMYRYRYVDKLVPIKEDTKLFLGTAIHKGLEAYYQPKGTVASGLLCFDHYADTQREAWGELTNEEQQEFEDTKELGLQMLENYFAWAAVNDDFEMVATESTFRVPRHFLYEYTFAGRLDGIVKDQQGNHWLKEFKTCSVFPRDIDLRLSLQAGLYLLACPAKGMIYTHIRKTNPKRAKVPVIQRTLVTRNKVELQNLSDRLGYFWLIISNNNNNNSFQPTPGQHCSWQCAYTKLCLAEEDGSDSIALKETFFKVVDTGATEKEICSTD